jgi:hypothetical protein
MRGPQIYGRKFHPNGGAAKFTDLNFIQTEGPQIFTEVYFWTTEETYQNLRPIRLDEIYVRKFGVMLDLFLDH